MVIRPLDDRTRYAQSVVAQFICRSKEVAARTAHLFVDLQSFDFAHSSFLLVGKSIVSDDDNS